MRNILQNFTSKRYRLFWHLTFWIAYVVFFSLFYGNADGNYRFAFSKMLLSLPVKILFTYTLLYFLPKYLLQRRYLKFAGILIGACLLFGLLQRTVYYFGYGFIYDICFDDTDRAISTFNILNSIISMYIVAVLAIVIKLIKHIYKKEKEQQELAQKTLEAELKFLKSQIHPHFLFNTLNNLYALTLKNSKKAPEVVLKLADLLDYMLYECNANKIPVEKEVNLINNYLSLEKLRYGDRLDVSFNYSVENMGIEIAPMMILPFVENSFKHGVSNKTDSNWVLIDLTIKGNQMTLKVENSKPDESKHRIIKKDHHEGIGLANVKRRLNLMYENAYDLQIFNAPDTFLVVLKLELDEITVTPQLELA